MCLAAGPGPSQALPKGHPSAPSLERRTLASPTVGGQSPLLHKDFRPASRAFVVPLSEPAPSGDLPPIVKRSSCSRQDRLGVFAFFPLRQLRSLIDLATS